MTEEQYKKYERLYSELQPVKTFLSWCGDRYKNQSTSKFQFKIITKAKNFFPEDLQKRIIALIEEWVEEKENKMENI